MIFLSSFESVGLSSLDELKKDFQDGEHIGFPIKTNLATFDLQVTQILPSKFRISWPFGSEAETQNRFSRQRPWQPSWISNRNEFSYFFYTLMFPTKFQVNWPIGPGEEKKQIFKMAAMVAIMDFLRSFKSVDVSFQEKRKIDFQNGRHDGHLGFPTGTILTSFDLQVISMLPTKLQVKWPFGSVQEAKNRFPSWTSDQKDFSYVFFIYRSPRCLPSFESVSPGE